MNLPAAGFFRIFQNPYNPREDFLTNFLQAS